jgi:hypothetical protein
LLSGVIFSVELVTGGCLLLFQLWKQKEYMLKGHERTPSIPAFEWTQKQIKRPKGSYWS